MLVKLFLQILNMSFTASFVIAAVIIVRFLLNKMPHTISYALWSVVLFRLVCPFSFESIFSLMPIKSNSIPQGIVYQQIPQVDTGIASVDGIINAVLPAATPAASMNPLQGWLEIAALLWLVGVTVLLVYSVASLLLLRRRLQGATCEGGNVYHVAGLLSPFVVGTVHPRIYLPMNLTECEKRYILLHEQMHIKRLDHVAKIAGFTVLCLHWFNPLVWVAFFLCNKDMEMSCDEAVIQCLGGDAKKEYSSLLLSFATGRQIVGGSPLAFGEGDTKSRIKNVLHYKRPTFWVIIGAATAVVMIAIGLAANPKVLPPGMQWAKKLTVDDVQAIEFVRMPSQENNCYTKFNQDSFQKIVSLINQSSGTLDMEPEAIAGGSQTFYITTIDGKRHSVSNNANTYLIIDAETYKAPYSKLGAWNFSVTSALPEDFQFAAPVPTPEVVAMWNARMPYVGNNSAVGKLLELLPLPQEWGHDHFQLRTAGEERGLEWYLNAKENIDNDTNTFRQSALLVFALIDNLEDFYVTATPLLGDEVEFHYDRQWADEQVGSDIRDYAASPEKLQELI